VLHAPTGAGKTTRVPPALLDAGLGPILVLEPRRIAVRAASARIASERDVRIGAEVGYQVRFDRRAGPATTLLIATYGIALRLLQADPFLERFAAVVADEVHERAIQTDLVLGMIKRVQQARPELRLVAMSATADHTRLARWLDDCPVIVSTGRMFPVQVRHAPRLDDGPVEDRVAAAIRAALPDGDVLAFLPGVREIERTQSRLYDVDADVHQLFGALEPGRQDAALRSGPRTRVVLATNVAETSVTVDGIATVVDSGLERRLRHDSRTGLDRLEMGRISRASAAQRAGRAGRVGPGTAIRLWTAADHAKRRQTTPPEVHRLDLAGPVLQLRVWGEADPAAFPWPDPPTPARLQAANALLTDLGAIGPRGHVTPLGQAMARVPAHPRVAAMLLRAAELGHPRRGAILAALLSERSPFDRDAPEEAGARIEALDRLRTRRAAWVRKAADALLRTIDPSRGTPRPDALAVAALAGWPDRVAVRRASRHVLIGGRGLRSTLPDAAIVALAVTEAATEARCRLAIAVPVSLLDTNEHDDLRFDPTTARVVATRQLRYRDLVLEERPIPTAATPRATELLAAAAAADLGAVLPTTPAWRSWSIRARCLAAWRPDLDLPPLSDAELAGLLPALGPATSFAQLRRSDWLGAAKGRLSWSQQRALDELAPETLQVPSGSRIRLDYELGRPPVLAVRMQELFGLSETPTVAGGRVPVLLHLLAPNMRVQQVTDDLAGFWQRTWPQLRKELRGRYPKHAWPEDPMTASPQRRPRRRP
jgi:ATP-dependent helicase HrpB